MTQTHADLWATSSDSAEPEHVYAARWELVRLIREAGEQRTIAPEEMATWRPRPDHAIGLSELCAEAIGRSG